MAIDKIQRVPGLLQLEFVEDDTVTWQLTFVDANSDAIDLSSRSYSAQIITPRDVQAAAITVDTTNAATGILALTIDNTLTDGLGGDKLRWELVETVGGEPKTLLSGPCIVHKPGYGGTPSTPTNAATVQYVSDTTVTVTATDLSSVAGPLGGGTDVTITTPADDDLLAYDAVSGDWINQSKSEAGFGTIATQDANNVAITGGSVTGITDVTVADGGTGASTAAGARTNLDVYSTSETDSAIDTDVATHNAATTSVHGIADTSALETATGAQAKADAAQSAAEATAAGALASHEADTTSVHGIADTSALLDAADIGVTVQAHSAVLDATTASFTTADESKLDGIEAGADVTDATNVDAAGAVMEADYNANTVLAATTDDTPAALTVGEQTLIGRITGGNIAALTPAQIRTLINVEDGADVTDATNVDAAGAVMNSDTSTASMGFVVDEDDMASDSATKVPTQQSTKAFAETRSNHVVGLRTVTADTTLALSDQLGVVEVNHATDTLVVTVPPNSSVAFPTGSTVDIVQAGAGRLQIGAGTGVTIQTPDGLWPSTSATWEHVRLYKRATDEWVAYGDLLTTAELIAELKADPDTLLYYDAASSNYDGGQIPYDDAGRHFDGYLGSLWPANIAPAGYEPTTDLSVDLSGSANNYILGEDAAKYELTTTGELEFVIRVNMSDWSDATYSYHGLISKWDSPSGTRSWAWRVVNNGAIQFLIYNADSSTTTLSWASPGLADGNTYWLKVTVDQDNGSNQYEGVLYYAADSPTEPSSWTTVSTQTASNVGLTPNDGTDVVVIGSEAVGVRGAEATVYRAIMRNGIGGTAVADLDFTRDAKAGETSSVTDLIGNVWTFNGTLEVTDENGLSPNTKALRLPGTSGNYVSTPDTAALDITGDIDIRCHVALDDWTPASTQYLVSKFESTGDQRSYQLSVASSGVLQLGWYTDGTSGAFVNVTSSVALTTVVADGEPVWVRATLDVSTGNVNFYTSSDGASWTQFGTADRGGAGATSIHAGTAEFEIGSQNDGFANVAGLIYAVEVYDGIAGTQVVDVDFDRDAGLYDTSFTGGDGLVYTVNQSAATTNDPLVFGAGANADYSFTGEKYVYVPGTSGNYLSTPDAAALDITGDIDVRAKIAPDSLAGGTQALVAKFPSATGQRSYLLQLVDDDLRLLWTEDGSTSKFETSSVAALTSTDPVWVRATLDVDNGASDAEVNFYTSTDGTSWSQVGATQLVGATTSIFSGTSPLEIGVYGASTFPFAGLIYAVEVYDGIAGTKVIDLDVNRDTIAAAHSTITDAQGNVWTVNRSAAPSFQATIIDRPCWLLGADTYIEVPESDDWHVADGGEKTVMIAGRLPTTQANYARIFCCRESSADAGWMFAQVATNDQLYVNLENDAGLVDGGNAVTTSPGEPIVLAGIFSDIVQVRLNGTTNQDLSRSSGASTPDVPLRVGSRSDTVSNTTSGAIHFAAVFDRALTEAELQALEATYGAA